MDYANVSSTALKVQKNFVLVRPETEETTDSGIVLVKQDVMERPTRGTVVSVSSKVDSVSPGEKVVWPVTDGIDLGLTDGYFILLKETSILAVIE